MKIVNALFQTDPALYKFSRNFSFYSVTLMDKIFILGVLYLDADNVRKIRISLSGILIEDLTYTIFNGDLVKKTNTKGNTLKRK